MDRCPQGGVQWRRDLTPWLQSRGVVVMDPTDKPLESADETPEARRKWREAKSAGSYDALAGHVRLVRHVDLRMVDHAHFIVAFIDMEIYSTGTWEEFFLANRSRKPILVVCPQGKMEAPDWIFGSIPHQMIFGSFDDLKAYLDRVDTADEVETYGRWVFFNQKKLYTPAVLERLLHLHAGEDASSPKNAVRHRTGLPLPLSV